MGTGVRICRRESRCTCTRISWRPSSGRICKSGRRRADTEDCAITGDSKCADSTQRPTDTETAPWASNRERTDLQQPHSDDSNDSDSVTADKSVLCDQISMLFFVTDSLWCQRACEY